MDRFRTVEMERAVTACAMRDPAVLDLVDIADIWDRLCRQLWRAMSTLRAEGKPFDAVTLASLADVEVADVRDVAASSIPWNDVESCAAVVRARATERRENRCAGCPHPPHYGTLCNGRVGGTAYPCCSCKVHDPLWTFNCGNRATGD